MKNKFQLVSILCMLCFIGCGGEEVTQESVEQHFAGATNTTPSTSDSSSDATYSFVVTMENEQGDNVINIDSNAPGLARATLLSNNVPVAGILVRFNLSFGLATLDPSSATALTNENGVASIIVNAADVSGADKITATVEGGISSSLDFSITSLTADLSMTTPLLTPEQIGAHGIAAITVTINETINGQSQAYQPTLSVNFTSTCVELGLATIESPVMTVNGTAQATYKDIACGQTDIIEISTQAGQNLLSQTAPLMVQSAAVGSLVFVGASNNFIALQGTGGSGGSIERIENSTLTFQAFDTTGSPASFANVSFSLSSNAGGLSLNQSSGTTDINGFIEVVVLAGNIPTSVRVIAALTDNSAISSASDLLVVSTGVADYNSFSLSVSELNVESWRIDGVKVKVVAHVSDHFNNPVPDGTAILFNTEFGQIEASCLTENGRCSVDWTSSEPRTPIPEFRDNTTQRRVRGDGSMCLKDDGSDSLLNTVGYPCFYSNWQPATNTDPLMPGGLGHPYGNRVTIFAHMIGEESFADSNGNGLFDANEAYTDIPAEGFRDDNEDGLYGALYSDGSMEQGAQEAATACLQSTGVVCLQPYGDNEEYVDFNNNGRYDWQGNNLLNNVLCQDEGNTCTKALLPIWRNITILQSGTFAAGSFAEVANASISLIEGGAGLLTRREDIANYFNQVDISVDAKLVIAYVADLHNGRMPAGTTIEFFTTNGEIVGPSSCTVFNSSALGFEGCPVLLEKDDTPDTGELIVKVTTPSGATTVSNSITITD